MPRWLALRLLIAWFAWIPMASAQQPGPQGYPGPGFHGMAPDSPYGSPSVPMGYQLQPTLYEQLIPPSSGPYYDMDPLADLGLAETLSRSWVRTEYMWLNYRDPAGKLIGATPAAVAPDTFDPNAFFPALDRITGVRVFQEARVTNYEQANNRDNSGFRLTFGIPTREFTFEASAFTVADSTSDLFFPNYIDTNSASGLGPTVMPVIPLMRDGLPSDQDFILFDQGMAVRMRSSLSGGDLRLVLGALTPNVATEVAPVIGFNALYFGNETIIRGDDVASNTSHRIDSHANNYVFGPEVGMRMETRSKWVTLGFEPKLTLGINRMQNRVNTSQIFSSEVDPITLLPEEPDAQDKGTLTRFAPMIDLSTYARIRMSEGINLTLGYQFMAVAGVSMSEDNIVWDSSSNLNVPPLIRLRQTRSEFWAHGINLGLEWHF